MLGTRIDGAAVPAVIEAARVLALMGDTLTIATANGLASAIVPGRLHYMSSSNLDLPTVGDWVSVRPGDPCVIEGVLARTSQLVRKGAGRSSGGQLLAANIDICWKIVN